MKNLTKLLIGAALFAGSVATANAQVSCNAGGCTGPATEIIQGLFPSPDGGILIQSALTTTNAACTGVNGNPVLILPATHANYNQTYATLLTASVSNANVQLRIQDGVEPCTLFFTRFLN